LEKKPDLLPNSRARESKNVTYRVGFPWVPIFCANCGADGGAVPEEHCDFAFYLCNPCAEKWGQLAGTMTMPDEVFWQKVTDAYGRELTEEERIKELDDESSLLSKLTKEK
jgi:hypothetical protein